MTLCRTACTSRVGGKNHTYHARMMVRSCEFENNQNHKDQNKLLVNNFVRPSFHQRTPQIALDAQIVREGPPGRDGGGWVRRYTYIEYGKNNRKNAGSNKDKKKTLNRT